MPIRSFEDQTPVIAKSAYIDETALVIGDVSIGEHSSLWPMVVARGDVNRIVIGAYTNIQDSSILHVTHDGPFTPGGHPLYLGDRVTVASTLDRPKLPQSCRTRTETERSEPRRDRQLSLGHCGPHPRHLQARQVPGRDPAPDRSASARLRARRHEGEDARDTSKAPRKGPPEPRAGSPHSFRLRLLQHLAVRLREAPRRRTTRRAEPAQLHRRLQPQHARGTGEVRLRQHDQQARRGGTALPGAGAVQERGPAPGQDRQPDHGYDLRGADPQVQRGAERESGRALHAARRRAPDGGPDAGRRRVRDPRQEGDPHRV